jgi:hypothetical protein
MKIGNNRDPSPDLVTEEEQLPSSDATKTSCAVITASSSKSSSSTIGAYRYAPPDPDDPFATEEDEAGGEIIPCPITIVGDLRQRRQEFQDKVQLLEFVEFEGLPEFMASRRQGIERKQEAVLKEVHECFQEIVRDVLIHRKLYHSVLGEMKDDTDSSTSSTSLQVGLYATPNVRLGRGKYASFLHSDSTFLPIAKKVGGPDDNNNNSCNTNTPRLMVNVWIILNDRPPNNQLMFYQSLLQHTRQSGSKLHGQYDHIQGETLVYDQYMCWGSFYCFVSGEAKPENETGRVLLHGAVDIPGGGGCNNNKTKGANHRKSIELRYLV